MTKVDFFTKFGLTTLTKTLDLCLTLTTKETGERITKCLCNAGVQCRY